MRQYNQLINSTLVDIMTLTTGNQSAQITISTPLYGTEDPVLVRKALSSIVDPVEVELENPDSQTNTPIYQVIGKYNKIHILRPLYRQLRNQRIVQSARGILRRSIRNDRLMLFFHKQAAVSGYIHFCAVSDESPLGPIQLSIAHQNFEWFIDWLTPETEHGKIIRRLQPLL